VLFVGDKVMAARIEIEEGLYKALSDLKEGKIKNINVLKSLSGENLSVAKKKLVTQFKNWGLATVVGAGLIDGINPCAFATIVFLISYLAYAGRKRRDVAVIGGIYTLSVFVTYMAVGVIFYDVIDRLKGIYSAVSNVIFYFTLAMCIIFAGFTLYDFIKALKKKGDEMKLSLSKKFHQKIHKVIREKIKMRSLVISSIIIGFLVSMFELACTGQVYLPTIMFILHKSDFKSSGLLYLLIYNIAFIIPLLIIFVLNLTGVSSKKLSGFLQKNLALTKILLFILFAGISAYLILERFIL
jgi:cytochrome c biogenesis protein CcdA